MAKLFFTLYLMVIASFVVFILYMASIDFVGESFGAGASIDQKVSRGTFLLLNESLKGLDSQQSEMLITQYKKIFGKEFASIELSSIDLDKQQLDDLNNDKVVSVEASSINLLVENIDGNNAGKDHVDSDDEELDILYYKRPGTSQVWRAELDYELDIKVTKAGLVIVVTANKFADAMMHLLQLKLHNKDQSKWQEILHKIQPEFGLPLKIIDADPLIKKISHNEKVRLNQNKVANISLEPSYATLAKKIPHSSKLLQVGPVEIPWYLRNFIYLFIASFILAFATTLFLWLWPFWSNLLKIKSAAEDFGSGNYNARIANKWWSPIAKISTAFNSMAEQTQNSIRQQKELTSAVSHELRTPVARMRFALEMLQESDDKKSKTRFVKDINEDIDELDLLLEELLSYARIDQKEYKITPSMEKLIPWLSNSMEKLMPLAKNKILNYQVEGVDVNETALFEPRLMSRILDNLIQNALRYAHQNVEVTLTKDNQSYLLIVEDDGDGIPKSKRQQVFDAFSRIDASRDRASGGFGLGLAIVDRIIKAHNGDISLHDSALGGARFEVRWPEDFEAG